jgi:toxin YoeB
MGKYTIELTNLAKEHLQKHKKNGKQNYHKKITSIFEDLENHPYTGIGKPESLKHNLSGYWSRRINQKDRILYIGQ